MVKPSGDSDKTPIPFSKRTGLSVHTPLKDVGRDEFQDLEESDSLRDKLRRNLVNIGIILIAGLLIFLLRSCLLGHFFPSSQSGIRLATLDYLFNKVVHRDAGEANFKNANLDQLLYENDALRTYENSHAEMLFEDGSLIRVDENTLVILKRIREGLLFGERQFALYLEQGGTVLNLKPHEEIIQILKTPFGEVKLKAKAGALGLRVNIQILPDGSTRISNYSGDGVIEINGEKITLNQNQYIYIGKDLKAVVRLLPRSKILILPDQEPTIFTRKVGQEVTFEWSVQTPSSHYLIELARDEKFSDLVAKSYTPNTFFTDRIIGAGQYYWRVQPLKQSPRANDDPNSPPAFEIVTGWQAQGSFLMVFDDPSAFEKVLIDPQRNVIDDKNEKTTVYFQADYPLVTFSWKPHKKAKTYRLEIFLDEKFSELELAKDLQQNSYSTQPGFFNHTQYFWQVIAINESGEPIHVSDIYELKLIYDNALPYLSINEPDEDALVQSAETPVSGVIPKEASLFVETQKYEISSRGKFAGSVALPEGTSQVVFKAIGEDGRIEYHTRTVTRPL